MDRMNLPVIVAERMIRAEPAAVFDVLADPAKHATIDGSGSVRKITSSTPRLQLGSTFGAEMRIGLPYRITNTVVEFEEDRRIAWRHFGGHRWRYLLTSVDGGTLVREEWDASRLTWWRQGILRLLRFPGRNRRGMEETLRRLDDELDRATDAT
jgi:uncharacterized protein YndB with AHSA1/START domain